ISINDNGHGIPKELQERIFDPFFTTKAPGSGTGLGLAIVRSLVTSMNGKITVHSEVEKGTTFAFELPAVG
ncbi:MAG TPA: HAMP domain-containing sensor histidine kinase, partial [Bdellovibrionota bacterium]|nr:HAMP domain-containing sensor histidine kinase [Bdellovibrionota bacterium]